MNLGSFFQPALTGVMDGLSGGLYSKAMSGQMVGEMREAIGNGAVKGMQTAADTVKMGTSVFAKELDKVSPGTVDKTGLRPAANNGGPAVSRKVSVQAGGSGQPTGNMQAIEDSITRFQEKIGGVQTNVRGITNHFDPKGQAFQKVLAGDLTRVNNQFGAAAARMPSQLAQQGVTSGASKAVAAASLEGQRRAARSGTQADLYRMALDKGSQFELAREQTLGSLAQGEASVMTQGFGTLEGLSNDRERIGMAREEMASNKHFREESLKIQRESMEYARQMGADANTSELWGNLIASSPALLTMANEMGIGPKQLWERYGPELKKFFDKNGDGMPDPLADVGHIGKDDILNGPGAMGPYENFSQYTTPGFAPGFGETQPYERY